MTDFTLFNLNQLLENIHRKYKIPKCNLKKQLDKINHQSYAPSTQTYKIYRDIDDNPFILLTHSEDYYYALKFD